MRSFNRTKLELKSLPGSGVTVFSRTFNRTKLELKLEVHDLGYFEEQLLIAPSWN